MPVDDELWEKAKLAVHNNDSNSFELFRELSVSGDWRGSYMLGVLYQDENSDLNYTESKKWFEKSILQHDNCESHYGLARCYYFGLGEDVNFDLAYEHLVKSCLDSEPAAVLMLGELYFHGLGINRDFELSRMHFSNLVKSGYPAGSIGLARISKARKKYFWFLLYAFKAIYQSIIISATRSGSTYLLGLGNKNGNIFLS